MDAEEEPAFRDLNVAAANPIRVLPDAVARKIAAGEVIERPASVVKELVENALDAGARRVVVELEQGGRSRIAVTDDGQGMAHGEVLIAFEPHATSKIRSEGDLLRIATLGFRGEALPSIAAVSEVELWTRRRGESVGTHVRIRHGAPTVHEDTGTAIGCRFEARDLFFTTPARRKFLKSPATEAGHVAQLIGRLALARPEVAFLLCQDGRETLSLPADTLRARARRVLGAEAEAEMRPAEYDGPPRVSGLVTHPHFTLGHSRSALFFVNGRWVRDRVLQHALVAAYATLIPRGRYPGAVLFLDLAPEAVDVNVHPSKLEVRFRDAQSVHEAIGRAVRGAITSYPGASDSRPPPGVAEPSTGYRAPGEAFRLARPPLKPGSGSGSPTGGLRLVPAAQSEAPLPFAAPGRFSDLRVIGQAFDGYLVCEQDGELVLIDQHAAHERVAFEMLRAGRARGRIETQPMLVPQPVEVGVGEVDLLADAAEELAACGLEIEPFGERAVVVRSTPALLPAASVVPLVRGIAAELVDGGMSRAITARTDALLATIACHSVVRVGQRLSEPEMRGLLAAMDSIDLNSNCPHGRPVSRRLARSEIERLFGR